MRNSSPWPTRFRAGTFEKLKRVRDSILRAISTAFVEHRSHLPVNEALKSARHFYSFTQIMGWHVLVAPLALHSIAELRDPVMHLTSLRSCSK